jgi:AraC-like DNA-binding protein
MRAAWRLVGSERHLSSFRAVAAELGCHTATAPATALPHSEMSRGFKASAELWIGTAGAPQVLDAIVVGDEQTRDWQRWLSGGSSGCTILIAGCDDGAPVFSRLIQLDGLDSARTAPLVGGVLAGLPAAIRPAFRIATLDSSLRSSGALAAAIGCSRSSLYRLCDRAGVASPHTLLYVAKCLGVACWVQAGLTIKAVAYRAGFRDPGVMRRRVRTYLGIATSAARALRPVDLASYALGRLHGDWRPVGRLQERGCP